MIEDDLVLLESGGDKVIKKPYLMGIILSFMAISLSGGLLVEGIMAGVVSPEVSQALETAEEVAVIILLEEPVSGLAPLSTRMESIAALQNEILATLTEADFRLKRAYRTIAGMAGKITETGLEKLASDPRVRSIELDKVRHIISQPLFLTRPELDESVPLINANDVHAMGITGSGVTVAVLDTGIDTDHLDLSNDLVAQHCFTDASCPPDNSDEGTGAEDDQGHGTSVAGIITSTGTNGIAPKGVAPDAGIAAIKVCGSDGNCRGSDIVAGIDWAIANKDAYGIRVINLSLGGGLYTGICDADDPAEHTAITVAKSNGIITFAASGNDGSGTEMNAPACTSNAVSVGSVYDANVGGPISWGSPANCTDPTTNADKVVCFTNSNPYLNLMAPGAFIDTTTFDGWHSGDDSPGFHGTSSATPHAAAVAALLVDANSSLTPSEIQSALESTGTLVTDSKNSLTFPRIDAQAAVLAVMPPGTAAVFRVTQEGDVYADQAYYGAGFNSGNADIAEYINVSEPVELGDLVELDPEHPGYSRKSRTSYSTLAEGVISTAPGITMGGAKERHLPTLQLSLSLSAIGSRSVELPFRMSLASFGNLPSLDITLQGGIKGGLAQLTTDRPLLALMGVVPVKATTENGPIWPGDLLVSSSTPGYVMRCGDPAECDGALVGKALEPLEEGEGLIEMLVMR